MKTLEKILSETSIKDINLTLKRAFSALADPVVIDGHEAEFITILVNLTKPAKEAANLQDHQQAKRLLQSQEWRSEVLACVNWLHTHNIKYPDARATGRVFLPDTVIPTEKNHKRFGWSHNSSKINFSKFLCTEFLMQGQLTSFAELFCTEPQSSLIKLLIANGFPDEAVTGFRKICQQALQNFLPDEVSTRSPVLLFPISSSEGEYIATTPVVSAEVQRQIHNLVANEQVSSRPVFHQRPAAIGSHLAACGGKLYCLHSSPKLAAGRGRKLKELWDGKHCLLDERALLQKNSIELLYQMAYPKPALKGLKQKQTLAQDQHSKLFELMRKTLSNLYYLHACHRKKQPLLLSLKRSSHESQFITDEIKDLTATGKYFSAQFHQLLEVSDHSAALAYHPKLLGKTQQAIQSALTFQTNNKYSSNNNYLHFERLVAYDANARAIPYILGLPSLTAWAGLVHNLLCNLGFSTDEEVIFAFAVRKFAVNNGHPAAEQFMKFGRLTNGPLIDNRSCDIEFDLIISLPVRNRFPELSKHTVLAALPRRFAGGQLTHPIKGLFGSSSFDKSIHIHTDQGALLDQLTHANDSAQFVCPTDFDNCQNNVAEFANALADDNSLIAIGNGYQFLEDPKKRYGSQLHCFSQNSFRVAQLKSIEATSNIEEIFWKLTSSDKGVFVNPKEISAC